MHFGFFSNQFRTILLTGLVVHDYSLKRFCIPSTFSFSWRISSSFLGPTIFSLLSCLFLKVYPNAATWVVLFGKSLQSDLAVAVSPLLYWSTLVDVLFSFVLFLHFLSQIEKNHFESKKGEPVMQSLTEGIKFVFNNKTILGAITLDMVFVLLVEP
jgi:hypothetical protein